MKKKIFLMKVIRIFLAISFTLGIIITIQCEEVYIPIIILLTGGIISRFMGKCIESLQKENNNNIMLKNNESHSNMIVYIFLICLFITACLNILEDHRVNQKLQVLEGDFVKVINLSNGNEIEIEYSVFFGEDRRKEFFSGKELGIDLKKWERDYKLIFYKTDKEVQASIYTMSIENKDRTSTENNILALYNERYAIVKLEGFLLDREVYFRFRQEIYDNLEKLDL